MKVKIDLKEWTNFTDERPVNGTEIQVIVSDGTASMLCHGECQFGKFFGYTCDCNGYHKITADLSLIKYWKRL